MAITGLLRVWKTYKNIARIRQIVNLGFNQRPANRHRAGVIQMA